MKKYIKPETDVLKVEITTILAGSLQKQDTPIDASHSDAKPFFFDFTPEVEEETPNTQKLNEEWDEFEEEEI